MHDSRFVPRMLEMEHLVTEDIDVDHAADFVWEFHEEIPTLGLGPAVAW